MSEYKAPELTKIEVQSGISFAAYACPPSCTDIEEAGVCTQPVIDKGWAYHYCWDVPSA